MHPGDDPAVAARFLGWLQGRGEPLERYEQDHGRITELLAWELRPEEARGLPLGEEERERALRLIALWQEHRPSLPKDWVAIGGRDPRTWLSPLPPSLDAPVSAAPSLAAPRWRVLSAVPAPWVRHAAARALSLVAGTALLVLAARIAARFEPESGWTDRRRAPVNVAQRTAAGSSLTSDLELRRSGAELLACRRLTVERLVQARSAQLRALDAAPCSGDAACEARHAELDASLQAALAVRAGTAALEKAMAPLPRAECPSADWPAVLVEESARLDATPPDAGLAERRMALAERDALHRTMQPGTP